MSDELKKDDLDVEFLGDFALLSGRLRITDPCYSPDTWCAGEVKAKNGVWRAYALLSEEDEWGTRVSELVIWHSGYEGEPPTELTSINVGVDSGQCGFFCAETYAKVHASEYGKPGFYGTVCSLTSESFGGVVGFGAVSSSGFGDGSYDCHISKEGDEVVAARLIFIAEEDDEELDEAA